jgi:hypothetical protein
MAVISGPYTATLGGTGIGMTEEGFRLSVVTHQEFVNSDDHGDAPFEAIQRGVTYRIQLIAIEYDLIKAAMAQQINGIGESKTHVGKRLTGLAQTLILTAAAGTPADAAGMIKQLTATKAVIVTDFDILLAAKCRKGPVTFQLFPDPAVSYKAFVTT